MLQKKQWAALSVLTLVVLASCKKDDPEPTESQELITTVRLTFTPSGGGTSQTITWKDADGDGGAAPVVTPASLSLSDGTTYTTSVEFSDESKNPVVDITEEVEEEDEEHQVFYQDTPNTLFSSITYDDTDNNGNPVGLITSLITGPIGSGTLKVTLIHEPNKTGSGVSNGNIANAGGETDVEVDFPITIVD